MRPVCFFARPAASRKTKHPVFSLLGRPRPEQKRNAPGVVSLLGQPRELQKGVVSKKRTETKMALTEAPQAHLICIVVAACFGQVGSGMFAEDLTISLLEEERLHV